MIHKRILVVFCSAVAALSAQPAPPAVGVPPAPAVTAPPAPPAPPAGVPPWDPAFGESIGNYVREQVRLGTEMAFQRRVNLGNGERWYSSGERALDRSQWDQALSDFTRAAADGGTHSDGALYWKAYALNKLGRRDEALAAIADLRKTYPMSRWLDDAKVLELEVKQAAGQNVSPESQSDEDLKLIAINALVRSDPDRAYPLLENLLKGTQSPRVKERALFVLAQTNSPKAQQLLEQTARGGGNPDLQLKAINYLGVMRRGDDKGQVLSEIYSSANDESVKRAVVNALFVQNNAKALVDLARKEKMPEMKREIVSRLSTMRSKEATDYMMELLK